MQDPFHEYLYPELPLPKYTGMEFRRIRPCRSTAKEHVCGLCGDGIPAGSTTNYMSGVTVEIGFYHYHECRTCTDAGQIKA